MKNDDDNNNPPQPHKILLVHPPHFFNIVVHRNLQDRNLMIPKHFVRDYGKFLASSVLLKVPDGMEWKVGLTTTENGAVWMDNGWHQFAEHYGLEFGYFLVYRFDGNSTFHTVIFDPTGSEIQYSRNSLQADFEDDDGVSSDSLSLEILSPSPEKKKNEASFPCRQAREKIRNESHSFKFSEPKMKSEKPGFRVVMGKSSVEGRFNMNIPKENGGKYFGEEEFGSSIKVQNCKGKTWSLWYKWRRSDGKKFPYISSGWKNFAQQNLLKEGDVGFFQLIKEDHFLFTLQNSSPPPPISPKKKNFATTKKPSFVVNIPFRSQRTCILTIPLHFAKAHLSPRMQSAKLVVGNKQWKVKIKQYQRCTRFSAGWSQFVRQNGLESGDSCLFEMLNKNETQCVFKVAILKQDAISVSEDSSM